MDRLETTTHPFVVHVWLEESAPEAGQATWRGQITHVPSGERHAVRQLDDVGLFIAPYLQGMGVKLSRCWRWKAWLAKWVKQGTRTDSV